MTPDPIVIEISLNQFVSVSNWTASWDYARESSINGYLLKQFPSGQRLALA